MTSPATCADSSLAASEPLAGTATEAARWLLVEVRGAWGRDPVADTELPAGVRESLAGFEGRVGFVRRRERRTGATVMHVRVGEDEGTLHRTELDELADLPGIDFESGTPVEGPVLLVCAHGRRDACCARLGRPAFDALAPLFPPGALWQSSHLGGHRFAPNVVVLPAGVQLGRIPLDRAAEVAGAVRAGRIPLDLYRGRTIYTPHVQAAEIHVRTTTDLDRVADLRLVADGDARVTFATPAGELTVRVGEQPGPHTAPSCGADPEPTIRWETSTEPAAAPF